MRHHSRRFVAVLCCLICGLYNRTGAADVFAPGELSHAHENASGITNCDSCHGKRGVEARRCLKCHEPLAARIRAKKGYHGRDFKRSHDCTSCHKEHQGRSHVLIPWPDGDMVNFDHGETGWPLLGSHLKVKCSECHDRRRIRDKKTENYLQDYPEAKTQLGLSTKCKDCHFDEHRGSLSHDCAKCHDEGQWKKAPGFEHNRVFALKGAHQKVRCQDCHKPLEDPDYRPDAFPAPRASNYLKMNGLPHDKCGDCHQDPHRNRFGEHCLDCHSEETWNIDTFKELTFHDKTDFPLRGRHRKVPCKRCHPAKPGGGKRLSPIPHDRCERCHPSAHPDIPNSDMHSLDCRACHSFERFKPSRFSTANHDKTRLPLRDAHRTVACTACHLEKMGDPLPAHQARKSRDSHLASLVISPWRMRAPNVDFKQCASCHQTPHRNQFKKRNCTECHDLRTWRIDDFDHSKTPFPLVGKHREVTCIQCHKIQKDQLGLYAQYKIPNTKECAPCHGDPHYGQFRLLEPPRKCPDCHSEEGFAPSEFDHNDPLICDFPLRGEHKNQDCAKCHPMVTLRKKVQAARYRPMPRDCESCHEDEHRGAYREAALLITPKAVEVHEDTSDSKRETAWSLPAHAMPAPQTSTHCAICHQEAGWQNTTFDHASTGFTLNGRHKKVPCKNCHRKENRGPLPLSCSSCHTDPHRGTAGLDCKECHSEDGFERLQKYFPRHNRTGFPLVGRHATLSCRDCHGNARDLRFDHTPAQCSACHEEDIPVSGQSQLDHSSITHDCGRCHTPTAWDKGGYWGHDKCFDIGAVSHHGQVSCTKCHQGTILVPTGNCDNATFSCTQCHGCLEKRHRGVSGYACEEKKCAHCHH